MLKTRIIPCLDVKNGRVVKGINFVDLKDAGDPVEQAKIYSDGGADEICFLDITASNENRDTIYNVVKETSTKKIPIAVPLLQYDWYLENNLAEFGLNNLPFADINQLASHIINRALKDGRQVFIGDANLYDEVKSDETHNNLHLIEW